MTPSLGLGTVIQVDRGSGMTTIVKNVMIGKFGGKAPDVDVTTHGSAAGIREFIRGLVDLGTIPFTGVYVADATQTALMADILAGNANGNLPYQIVVPGGYGTFAFNGYLNEFAIDPKMDGRQECDGVLKVSGVATFATTASAGLTTPFFSITPSTGAVVTIPAPANAKYDYVVELVTGATNFTVTPTATAGVITVNGAVVPTGTPSQTIALGAAGSITTVTISVQEAGKTAVQYVVRVARA